MTQPSPDPRWELAERVLAAPLFEKSPRLRAFLRYICESELGGRREQINEHAIGVQVFSRQPTYNPGDDSIVRSQARLLRQRLEEYFRTAGRDEPMQIVIPKGSYVPVFEASSVLGLEETGSGGVGVAETGLVPVADPVPVRAAVGGRVGRWWLVAAGVLVVVLAGLGGWWVRVRPGLDSQERFWATLFSSGRQTIIVPADSTLVLLEELTGEPVHLDNYLSRHYLARMAELPGAGPLSSASLSGSQYTSMADLNLVSELMRRTGPAREHAEVRYARDLSISDAKGSNLVLVGGARANPWVELFASNMNFHVDFDWKTGRNVVTNERPAAGEAPYYAEVAGDPGHQVYGLIAWLPSLDGQGSTLMVAGTSAPGTEAAADFLLSGKGLDGFFKGLVRPGGTIPHFELLLRAQNIGGNAPQSAILAYRLRP